MKTPPIMTFEEAWEHAGAEATEVAITNARATVLAERDGWTSDGATKARGARIEAERRLQSAIAVAVEQASIEALASARLGEI